MDALRRVVTPRKSWTQMEMAPCASVRASDWSLAPLLLTGSEAGRSGPVILQHGCCSRCEEGAAVDSLEIVFCRPPGQQE